jgi:hypothetical protein
VTAKIRQRFWGLGRVLLELEVVVATLIRDFARKVRKEGQFPYKQVFGLTNLAKSQFGLGDKLALSRV